MKKKRIFIISSLLLVMLFSVLAGACKSCKSCKSKGTDSIIPTITMPEKELLLDKEEISILLGESDYILAETVGMDATTPITFTSSDESVATVDGTGVITSKGVGTATITVTADGVEKTCAVSVTLGKYLPELSLKQIDGDEATIGTDGAVNFEPVVIFNHKEYTDAKYTYEVEDKTIGTVENGIFTATGKVGSTLVTVYADWCGQSGKTMAALRKTVTVTVATPIIELYTRASFEGKNYATSADISTVIDDENATDIQTSVITGGDVISISNNVITANTYGKAGISVTYKNAEAQTVEKKFNITVERPIAEYGEALNFSIMDGDIPVTAIWGSAAEVVEAYFGAPLSKGGELTVTDGKITAGVSLSGNACERQTVTLLTETEGYTVDFCVYTKFIDEASDLSIFALTDKDVTGAYLVTQDIDASDIDANAHTDIKEGDWNFDYAFTGTFDGGGYTVTANVDKGGLFGNLKNATITNANFVFNVTGARRVNTDKFPSGLAYGVTGAQATTTISGVYAELNPTSGLTAASGRDWALSLLVNADKSLILNDVVVVNNDDFANLNANANGWVAGALFYADGARGTDACDTQRTNVFVIAPEKLGNGYYVPMAGGTKKQNFASNDTAGAEAAKTNTGDSTQYIYANVTRYASLQELCASDDLDVLSKRIVQTVAEKLVVAELDGTPVQGGAILQKNQPTAVVLKIGDTVLTDVRLQSSDESVATVQGNAVTVENFGVAVITATGTALGVEITTTFSVTLEVNVYAQEVLFSGADGDVDMQAIFGEDVALLNAYGVDGTTYTVVNGKITDLTNTANEVLTKEVILEAAGDKLVKVTFKVYTKLLDEASDLTVFALSNQDVKGCYLVVKDIAADGDTVIVHTDLTQKEGSETTNDFDYKFKGVFDGGGHTVAVSVTNGGLFGVLENATVQNVNFIFNVQSGQFWSSKYFVTALAHEVTGSQATTTISNVYAELNPAENLNKQSGVAYALSLIANGSKAVSLNNVVVVNNDDFANLNASTAGWVAGALFYFDLGRTDSGFCNAHRTNVFVIAPEKTGNGYYVPMSGGTAAQGFASNDTAGVADAKEKTGNETQYTYAGVTRYSTAQDFVDGNKWNGVIPEFIMDSFDTIA